MATVLGPHSPAAHASAAGWTNTDPLAAPPTATTVSVSPAAGDIAPSDTLTAASRPERPTVREPTPAAAAPAAAARSAEATATAMARAASHCSEAPAVPAAAAYPTAHAQAAADEAPTGPTASAGHAAQAVAEAAME
jgi:hypothetical protein